KMNKFIDDLMGKMTLEEKIGQLNLITAGGFVTGTAVNDKTQQKIKAGQIGGMLNGFSIAAMKASQEIAVKDSPHHIPILFGMDVIHGFRTVFPIPLAMSCMWDVSLIQKYARIAAQEATANGIAWTYSPMVDIARDPRWGRIAEGAGEDPWLGSLIARAYVRGYQGDDLTKNNTMMACVKHFALYGAAEGGRDYNTVDMSKLAMYNFYLPPYKAAVDAGAGSVMTSFNVVDYIPSTGNHWLLTELLRNQWGFRGFVVTDYTATNEMINHGMGDLQEVSALALKAGTDMDMVGEGFLTTLKKSLDEGKVTMDEINQACRRVLEAKYKLGLFDDPYRYFDEKRAKEDVMTPENIKTAREVAERSMVLLKNDGNILPLKKSGTIAVIGPLGNDKADMIGTWAMGGDRNTISTVVEGLKNIGGSGVNVIYSKGSEFTDNPMLGKTTSPLGLQGGNNSDEKKTGADAMLADAIATAKKADVVVAALGEPSAWSGEASSMSAIGLQKVQENLLKELLKTGKPVVLVLINGRPMTLPWENEHVSSILEAWAGGTEAGNAIAAVLYGDYNPSGKLTTTFPMSVGQIPLYYNHLNTGRPMDPKNKFTSKYLDIPNDPVYPFGYGLSYTTFSYGDIRLDKPELKGDEKLTATVTVTNTGKVAGEEIVQLYIRDPVASISRPVKELKNFKKILLEPGEKKDVSFEITTRNLSFYNSELNNVWEPGVFDIYIGTNSRDVKSAEVNWTR
ncbi:MAG TPA: beta-glucosidase BglX, partial [Bacteroidales bacterium]|nr:beta-glucosidase BglX [Bacteroidales bacterium]